MIFHSASAIRKAGKNLATIGLNFHFKNVLTLCVIKGDAYENHGRNFKKSYVRLLEKTFGEDPFCSIHKHYLGENIRLGGKSLLEAEMEFASAENRIIPPQCRVLVLLVGFSLEPLLQSVCAHKPARILLVLNNQYGKWGDNTPVTGNQFGETRVVWFHIAPLKKGIETERTWLEKIPLSGLRNRGSQSPRNVCRSLPSR